MMKRHAGSNYLQRTMQIRQLRLPWLECVEKFSWACCGCLFSDNWEAYLLCEASSNQQPPSNLETNSRTFINEHGRAREMWCEKKNSIHINSCLVDYRLLSLWSVPNAIEGLEVLLQSSCSEPAPCEHRPCHCAWSHRPYRRRHP